VTEFASGKVVGHRVAVRMAEDLTLKGTDRNSVFELLRERQFDPNDFQWQVMVISKSDFSQTRHLQVSVLRYMDTEYYFRFDPHHSQWSPGWQLKTDSGDWSSLNQRCEQLRGWLSALKTEIAAPDLWASLPDENILSAAASLTIDNRPFAPSERHLIQIKLDEIKAYLQDAQDFTNEQSEMIEREFAYLRESSERLGRKDWLNNLVGGLFGLAIGLALDPENAKGLLGLAGSTFQSLWNAAQTLLR